MVENLQGEEWRDIEGYEGLYQVSNLGRVKSLERCTLSKCGSVRKVPERIMKAQQTKFGYFRVCLCKSNKSKIFAVHRLVAVAFIPNPDNLPQINHRSEVKTDNRVENLEWCDAKYNNNYGNHNNRLKISLIDHPAKSKRIGQYYKTGKLVMIWKSTKDAYRNGFNQGNIAACARGNKLDTHSHKGYYWFYLTDDNKPIAFYPWQQQILDSWGAA